LGQSFACKHNFTLIFLLIGKILYIWRDMRHIYNLTLKVLPVIYFMYLFSLTISMAGMEIFGWTGIFLTLFVGLYEYVVNKKSIWVAHPLNKVFLVLALALFVSVITSPFGNYPEVSKLYYIGKIRNLIFFTYHLIIFNRIFSYKRALKVLLYFMLPIVAYALLQKFSGFDPIMGNWHFNWGFQNNSLTREVFNMYLTYINVFQFYFFIMLSFAIIGKIKPGLRIFLVVLVILFLVSFVFSASRAIVIAIFVGTLVQMFLSKRLIYMFMILTMALIPILAYKISPNFKSKADNTVQNLTKLGDTKRFQIYNTHLAMFKDYPIKGVGYGINEPITFEYYKKLGVTTDTGFRGHSHNIIVQMLAGTGLLGTIPFVALWVILFIMTFNAYKIADKTKDWYNAALCNGLLGGFTSFIVNGMTEWNFGDYETNHNLMFFIAVAGFVWLQQKKKQGQN